MRLIDADELKKCAIPCEIHNGALTDLCVPLYQINNAPTVERPQGKWEIYGDTVQAYDIAGVKTWGQKRRCTNCGFIKMYIEDFGFYSFCPNCGADMRGE